MPKFPSFLSPIVYCHLFARHSPQTPRKTLLFQQVTGILLRDKLLIPELARLVTVAEAEQEVLLLARLALKQLYFANPLCAQTGDHPVSLVGLKEAVCAT